MLAKPQQYSGGGLYKMVIMFNQNPANLDHVKSVKRRYEKQLMGKPGVVGVGISYLQEDDGSFTDQPCLIVTVEEGKSLKRSRRIINSSIPDQIEGVEVVVQMAGPIIGYNSEQQ